jgi:hypothetical protein
MLNTKPSRYTFEVWDLVSRNIVGEFDTEREALALVRALTTQRGQRATEGFALVREDEQGDSVTIATGEGLTDMALGAARPSSVGAS